VEKLEDTANEQKERNAQADDEYKNPLGDGGRPDLKVRQDRKVGKRTIDFRILLAATYRENNGKNRLQHQQEDPVGKARGYPGEDPHDEPVFVGQDVVQNQSPKISTPIFGGLFHGRGSRSRGSGRGRG